MPGFGLVVVVDTLAAVSTENVIQSLLEGSVLRRKAYPASTSRRVAPGAMTVAIRLKTCPPGVVWRADTGSGTHRPDPLYSLQCDVAGTRGTAASIMPITHAIAQTHLELFRLK